MISLVAYLQATAPTLATQLTRERLEAMKRIAKLEECHEANVRSVRRAVGSVSVLQNENKNLAMERDTDRIKIESLQQTLEECCTTMGKADLRIDQQHDALVLIGQLLRADPPLPQAALDLLDNEFDA